VATIVQQEPDAAAVEQFIGRGISDIAGAMTTIFCIIGDRLGLFRALDERPATAAELAARAGIDERYALEWLRGLASAGYVDEAADGRYVLPPAQAVVLAREGNPLFVGGAFQELGGILLGAWLPLLPELGQRLERGIRWADVGCGAGRAVIRLAQAFPQSTFAGFDVFPAQIERARAAAEAAGVSDRVSFEIADGAQGIPGRWDAISTFDVVHDAVDPDALVAGIRRSLADDGTYLMLEMNCADEHAENRGPLATVLYGFSILYCMTTSLAHGGAGLGTCGCPPAVVEHIARGAGFGTIREVPIGDPFNRLYELRA
jgi:SAM-dependent methyltransferase